jgi:hypothetical protein
VRILVGSWWTGTIGRLNDQEVQILGIQNLDNEYYAVAESMPLHFEILVKQLTHEARRIVNNKRGPGVEEPNLQYGIDVCTELISRFRSL